MNLKNNHLVVLYIVTTLIFFTQHKCVYNLDQNWMPFHVDTDPFELKNLSACTEYLEPGRLGCCNIYNDAATLENFKQIDGLFGSQGGGCDICAINLKRFWCQYSCSARQNEFMQSSKQLEPFPDPQKPGSLIMAQRVNVRVHADTACKLFESCKLNPFVASVSAMGSPSGFLNFQGHNAVNGGHQYISMNFSYNINDSLAFSDVIHQSQYEELNGCDYKTNETQIHGFEFKQNCTCNSCGAVCGPPASYAQPDILQGFNYKLVGFSYLACGILSVGITLMRKYGSKKRKE